jgi:hypothetical protein
MADRQLIRPLDIPVLKAQYANAPPFSYFVVEDFLEPSFAVEVAALQTAKRRVRRLIGRAIGRR